MNLSLDPTKLERPLRFLWFGSTEGKSWRDGLESGLAEIRLTEYQFLNIANVVAATLSRVGNEKFRRHFEIKPIALGIAQNLVELRWQIQTTEPVIHLRLYCKLRLDEGELVGLCFRPKRLASSRAATLAAQNQDIHRALDLAIQHESNKQNGS